MEKTYFIHSPGYRSTPRWERALSKFWDAYGKVVLVVAVMVLAFLFWQAAQPPHYSRADVQQLVAYAINSR